MTQPKLGYLYVVKPKYRDGPLKIGIAVFTPLWMREVGLMPNRPWHAAHVPTEIGTNTQSVQWPKWDESTTLRH